MRANFSTKHRRRGLTLVEVAVVIFLLVVVAALLLPMTSGSRAVARSNTCRNNMRALAAELFNSGVRTGTYPGYMNVLVRADGKLYSDSQSGAPVPVSWMVALMHPRDIQMLLKQPMSGTRYFENMPMPPISEEELRTNLTATFLCPSDQQPTNAVWPISYVVNTGLPDAPVARIDEQDPTRSVPRDWAANGMFFDNFSEHPLVKPDPQKRGPMVFMRDERVCDLKSRTIMLTENVDATSFLFDAQQAVDGWQAVEVQTGCIWKPGTIDDSKNPPTMVPLASSLQINVEAGKGDGKSFNYCRPSSRHARYVNVAFVDVSVSSLPDTISYFVYAKLMASDDEHVALPGEAATAASDPLHAFRTYRLNEEDINP